MLLAFAVLPILPLFHLDGMSDQVRPQMPYNLLFYLALLPNVANLLGMNVAYASQLWSIGVEEQFYLFWPWLLKNQHRYERLFFTIIIAFVLVRNVGAVGSSHLHNPTVAHALGMVNTFLLMTRIDCMAIGGLAALYVYQQKPWFAKYFINRPVEVLSLAAIVLVSALGIYIPYIHHDFFAVVFSLFIVNTSCNPKSLFCLEGKVWTSLGNVSYGIYMYHLVAIGIVLVAVRAMGITEFPLGLNITLHIGSLLLTILIAQLSYRFFETPFLHLKERMTRVQSGSM
jgi:peptidoglycan/LPS O-acetylase OafA/YrhL